MRDITDRKKAEEELRKYRESLEKMAEKRTGELKVTNEQLQQEVIERKQAEKVQAALYKISEAAHAAENLEELYHSIHNIITELMPAKNNFYIALYDEDFEILNFPYFVDEYEGDPGPQKLGKGLTEYVLRTGKPLLASPEVFEELEKKGKIESVGPPSIDWLGVPLKTKNRTIGVLTVQSYTEGVRYCEEDKNILMFISEQVAMAIERKRAEEALRESEEKYRTILESIEEGYYEVDLTGNFTFFNDSLCRMLEYSKDELMGMNNREYMDEKSAKKVYQMFNKIYKTGIPAKELDFQIIQKGGAKKYGEISISLIKDSRNQPIGFRGIVHDITERKRAEMVLKKREQQIKSSLKEKEVLLKEIHHRVKNNMQIISSLLRLQSRQIKDEEILEIFNQSQNRIRSMALIHEELYKSKDLARIDFTDYINRLTNHLFSAYGDGMGNIDLKIEVKDVYLDIDRAIPCGLIISEIASNSLKHAFPDGRSGEISVKMHANKKDKYALMIKDTGVGIPEKLDFHKTETLGMQLVTDLVKQLDGTIDLRRNKGTEFKITFNVQK